MVKIEAEGQALVYSLERLSRLMRASEFGGGLNPAQWEALRFLSRANRFSNSPGALTRYLGATKGTISQTVKALERKKLIEKSERPGEKRSVVLRLTPAGTEMMAQDPWSALARSCDALGGKTRRRMDRGLAEMLAKDSIHDHPRGQRILRAEQRIDQIEPAATARVERSAFPFHNPQEPPWGDRAGLEQVATHGQWHVDLAGVGQRVGQRILVELLRLQVRDFRFGGGEIGLFGIAEFAIFVLGRAANIPGPRFGFANRGDVGLELLHDLRRGQRSHGRRRVAKHARQRIVVELRNGIELVIVATGTRDRQPEQAARESIDPIVERFGLSLGNRLGIAAVGDVRRTNRNEAGGHGQFGAYQVASELQANELIVGHIVIQRLDDPIAPGPLLTEQVLFKSVAIGVASSIQPGARPAFAVAGRSQEFLN